jgi:hypothetical protein
VNTHVEYRRHPHRHGHPLPTPDSSATPARDSDAAASALAHHQDPSLAPAGASAPAGARTALGVTWVRPTEIAAYAAPIVGRGIDLQAELIRWARRTSAATARTLPRLLTHAEPGDSTSIAPPTPRSPAPSRAPRSIAHPEGPAL